MAKLSLQDLRFRYPGALEDTLPGLNLEIASGAAHGLLGGSGTGKTTLLNLLSGLLQPQSGSLQFDGVEMAGVPGRQRNVAQVFQFPVLYPRLSVQENLALPLKLRGWKSAQAAKRVAEVARELELEPWLAQRPSGLSLYQKQLAAIGRAIVRPDIALVLLDEPLTAVEPNAKWSLRDLLRKVQREHGVTMVYVTHDQTEALAFADQISVMHQGQIVQTASASKLHDEPAHEHVGYFIGNPSMNFLPVKVREERLWLPDASTPLALGKVQLPPGDLYKLGFRSTWCRWDSNGLPVTVQISRPTGTFDGAVQYRVNCLLAGHSCVVAASGETHVEAPALLIERGLVFAEGRRVARVGLTAHG